MQMQHKRLQFSIAVLVVVQCAIAFACLCFLPFRPSLTFTAIQIDDEDSTQFGTFNLSVNISNTGTSSVYLRCNGELSDDVSLGYSHCVNDDDSIDMYWFPCFQPKHFGSTLRERPKMTLREIRPGETIHQRNCFLSSPAIIESRFSVDVTDWRGRKSSVPGDTFDMRSIPKSETNR